MVMISCRLSVAVVACIFRLLANKVNADCFASHDLENGTWALIGLPCAPPDAKNTAGGIFGGVLGSSAPQRIQLVSKFHWHIHLQGRERINSTSLLIHTLTASNGLT